MILTVSLTLRNKVLLDSLHQLRIINGQDGQYTEHRIKPIIILLILDDRHPILLSLRDPISQIIHLIASHSGIVRQQCLE